MNKWLERISILAVLCFCGFILFVGGQAAFVLGVAGIIGIAGIYSLFTLIKHFRGTEKPFEVKNTDIPNMPPPPSNLCPTCHHPLTFIEQYKAWYCFNCKEYK
jgi:hypothetical protein